MNLKLLSVLMLVATAAQAKEYKIDPAHSSVSFRVSHLGLSRVIGRFDRFTGVIDYEPSKPKSWKAQAEIDAASVNTQVEARDKHLRSADFFDVTQHPTLTFKSTKAHGKKLYGELTLHGVTKPVVLDLEIHGTGVSPLDGSEVLGATARGRINRRDFGVGTSMAAQLIGDEVEITLEVEATTGKKA